MEVKSFFLNVANIAKAPAVDNIPPLQVSKKDMKEILSYMEEIGVPPTIESEQEARFTYDGVNFMVIENDREEEVGVGGKVIEQQNWQATLSPEDQAVVDANTDAVGSDVPVEAASDPILEARVDSEPITTEEVVATEEKNAKSDKGAKKPAKK